MKLKIKCKWCNNIFERRKNGTQRFCSIKCMGKWSSKYKVGKNASNWKGGKIKFKCDNCGKLCEQSKSQYENQDHHYCNPKCQGEWRSKYNIGKNNPNYKEKIKVKCDNCGEDLLIPEWRFKLNKHYFCKNNKCFGEWRSLNQLGENNPSYVNGNSNFPYPPEFNDQLREFIRRRDGYKCMECGAPQKELIFTLEVHHIDYDKSNSATINLIALCKSCNVKANKNRPFWQNKYENLQIDRKVSILDMKLEMQLTMESFKE